MAFINITNETKQDKCDVCGKTITKKKAIQRKPEKIVSWHAVPHRAPCGAHCIGGGVEYGETNIHVPWFGAPCPGCGEVDSKICKIIDKDDASERAVFYQYIREQDFRIELEIKEDEKWIVKSRWPTNYPDSLEKTVKWAENYIPWINR